MRSEDKSQHLTSQDVGMGYDFLSQYRHLLLPLLFHEVTSLHPTSFKEMIFPLVPLIWGKALIKMRCMDSNHKGDYRRRLAID